MYLADSINVPVEKQDEDGSLYLEYYLDTEVEDFTLEIPLELTHSEVLGRILLACEDTILQQQPFERFLRTIRKDKHVAPSLSDTVVGRLRRFFDIIESLEDRDWDKIWCRIIKNNFSPRGFSPFDLIVGNPPWVRWSRFAGNVSQSSEKLLQLLRPRIWTRIFWGYRKRHLHSHNIQRDRQLAPRWRPGCVPHNLDGVQGAVLHAASGSATCQTMPV